MSKIYRATDIIRLKLNGLTIGVSPLTFDQKMEIQSSMLAGDPKGAMIGASMAVRYCLKELDGVTDSEGNKYNLIFDGNKLAQECWDDLQNLSEGPKLTLICLNLLNNVPEEFMDPSTGKKISGVSRIVKDSQPAKK